MRNNFNYSSIGVIANANAIAIAIVIVIVIVIAPTVSHFYVLYYTKTCSHHYYRSYINVISIWQL